MRRACGADADMRVNWVAGVARWGVPAGLRVNVTWLYLGRTREWEAQLPADIREQVGRINHELASEGGVVWLECT